LYFHVIFTLEVKMFYDIYMYVCILFLPCSFFGRGEDINSHYVNLPFIEVVLCWTLLIIRHDPGWQLKLIMYITRDHWFCQEIYYVHYLLLALSWGWSLTKELRSRVYPFSIMVNGWNLRMSSVKCKLDLSKLWWQHFQSFVIHRMKIMPYSCAKG